MLHVLHVDTGREWRGGQAQALGLLTALSGEPDLRQTLCAPPDSPLAQRASERGVEILRLSLRGEWDLVSSRAIRRFIREESVGIVHTHDAHAHAHALGAVRRFPGVRLVVHRRVDFDVGRGWFRRRKWGPRVDHVIAISEGVADVLERCGISRGRISVIPSGVDVAKFDGLEPDAVVRGDLGVPPNAPLIGNVAALVDHKGHVYLIDAMEHVLREIPEAHCVIVGEGELRPHLEQRIRKRGLEGHVSLAGWRSDVGQCLDQFDVFCLSSHKEGLCTSLLDAALMRVPLVAFRTGGVPDIVRDGETGWLAPVRDAKALAAAIVEALRDREEARRRAEAAHAHVLATFDLRLTAQRTLELWRRLAVGG
ncbi:glycosyltransferase [Candidatus Sumerlaeota bacterium]|nr:glycosyltransferase [Candidatus Sumerlaeota bacterium]